MFKEQILKRALAIVERGNKLSHDQQLKIFWPCFESVEAYPKHYDIDIDLSIKFVDRPESVRNNIIEKGYGHYLEHYIPDILLDEGPFVCNEQMDADEKWLTFMEGRC